MKSDRKRLNLITILSLISILSFILFIVLLSVGLPINAIVAVTFGYIFIVTFIVMDIVIAVVIIRQDWTSKWCLKYNVTFAILGLFFGWIIFLIFSGSGKVKIEQEKAKQIKEILPQNIQ